MLLYSLGLTENKVSQGTNRLSHDSRKVVPHQPGKSAHGWWSVFLSVIWVLIVLIICFLIALRLSLPGIGKFRSEVEQWIHTVAGQNVSIGSLHVTWHGWTPELVVKDIRLPNTIEDTPHIQSLRMRVGLDPLSFWEADGIRTKKILLSGVSLTIIRNPNGSIRLGGIGTLPSSTESGSVGLLSWLLQQPYIDVESANLRWYDEKNENVSFSMPNTHLSIRRDGPRHRVLVTMRPPKDTPSKVSPFETTNGSLSGMADIAVNPTTLNWSGSIFLRIEDFNLNRFPPLQSTLTPLAIAGTASLGFWTFWDKGQLEHIEGNFALRDLVFGEMNTSITEHEQYVGLPVKQKGQSIPIHEKNQTLLMGEHEKLPGKHEYTLPYEITNKKNLFDRMSGYLKLDRIGVDNWQLQLHQFTLATSKGEWPATHAKIQIAWFRNHHGWLLNTQDAELKNEDITIRLIGTGQWFEDHSSPDLRLVIGIEHRKLDKLGRYLPTSLMKDSLVEWLSHAFPKGELTEGRILFHGRIADFPFDNKEGVFEVRAGTSNATTLNYTKSWPPIEEMETDILFRDRRLTIIAKNGFIHGTKIEKTIAEIPDILAETPILTIDGHIMGILSEGLTFLREGPLGARYAHRVAGIKGAGDHRLDLKIQIPLRQNVQIRTQGNITFLNNTIKVDIPWTATPKIDDTDLTFDQVNGVLTFNEHGIAGESIAARYLNRSITLDVAKATGLENTTRFTMNGFDTDTLFAYPLLKTAIQEIPPSLSSLITDVTEKATWQIILDLPDDWKKVNQQTRLQITSHLRGTTVNLPPPLTGRPFQVEILLGNGNQQAQESRQRIRVRFGSGVTGIFSPTKLGKRTSGKWRGAIQLGVGSINLPKEGIRIHGHTSRFSLDQWAPLLAGLMEAKSESGIQRNPMTQTSPFGETLDLQAEISSDELIAFGQTFRNTTLSVAQDNDTAWHVQVQGDTVQGHVRIPRPDTDEIIAAAFTRLQFPSIDGSSKSKDFDLGRLPRIRLACEDFVYGTFSLGAIELLELSPNPQELKIKNIKIKSDAFRIEGRGAWKHPAQSHQSQLHIKINGEDLGKLLSSFGYEGKVAKKGKTHLELDIEWPGTPAQFDLEKISGTIKVDATDGRLLAIKPGTTGRVFGLLSVTLLPRRLLLDFRDIFQEGLIYDRMEGEFKIHEGHAETNHFFVEGPTSHINITGSTGLANKNYDQIATIVPKLSSSIPLAVIGIAQELIDSPFFDKAFSYQYTIGGTWSDPKIEPVESH
uniref:TIGR02099 family protein n=1 Tax=Candidatus Kentrum sp. TUN TaxID=2126343 RepID=A0A450ZCU9_9GAMM|nr:MAG: TIGR02099 family protein [Candidatus Kentron sp. TUN]